MNLEDRIEKEVWKEHLKEVEEEFRIEEEMLKQHYKEVEEDEKADVTIEGFLYKLPDNKI